MSELPEPSGAAGPDDAGPARPSDASPAPFDASPRAIGVSLAIAVGAALLGLAAGYLWSLVAPRALIVVIGHGEGNLVQAETTAFIAADFAFCVIALAGGALSGALGYLLGVRRYGPLPMAGVLAGAVAAGYLARWVGEQAGHVGLHHLLATLPTGTHLHASLTLRATGAIAFWPLAAGLVAGGLEAFATRDRQRDAAGQPALPRRWPWIGKPGQPALPGPPTLPGPPAGDGGPGHE
jgi:hypothetical protein